MLDDAGQGAAPTRVEGGDGVGSGVGYEDGDAVSGEDAEEEVGVAGVEGVAAEDGFVVGSREREVGAVYSLDDAGVALANGDQVGGGLAGFGEGCDEASTGGEDSGRIVFGGVAEVLFRRAACGVSGGEASLASAKAGDEPWILGPRGDGDEAGSGAAPGFRWRRFRWGWCWFGGTAAAAS